jgi:site-specific DNA-methyltransferase (adenine-specific)
MFPSVKTGNVKPYTSQSTGYEGGWGLERTSEHIGDSGSAARFFYCAKADADDRLGSKHPTVKPVDLMQYLCRLVTPPRGVILDPFAGTGTTGEAAYREGFSAVLIEREEDYFADIKRRMSMVLGGTDERRREIIKAKGLAEEAGPLFSGLT